VTLHLEGALRGCIGYPEAVFPLYQAIIRGAAGAALSDPRFPPVSREEVGALEIEISVLSLLAPIQPDDVVVGTHGLVIEHGEARGLLLPQVPTEWGWDREQFLHHTSLKAGLPGDAWRQGATLFAFTAEVFGEAFE
jgi:AmmeMemoRadiSam system protein A